MLAAQFNSRARSGHFARCRARSGHLARCRATSGRAVRSRATFGHRWACRAISGRCRAFRATFRHRRAPERTKVARQRLRRPKVARRHRRNVASVRISPGNADGPPRMSESRPKTRMACQASVQKPPANVAQALAVRFSPAAATTAPVPAVSRCAAVVRLRACRESALIPRGYERARTGRSLRHRARGR